MRNGERPLGVDGAPILWAVQILVHVECIGLASSAIARIPIAIAAIAGMQSYCHGVLVTLPSVVLRTPNVISQIGIAVIVTTLARIIAGHFNEISGRIAMAADVADIDGVAEVLVHEWSLSKWIF